MFKPFIRLDTFTRNKAPKISIRKQHIGFNGTFVNEANLKKFNKVKIYIDDENFRIGFKFHNSDDPHSHALFSDNPSNNTKATSATQLIKQYGFIKKISELQNVLDRQFEVNRDIQDKNFWVAQLCPAFEHASSSISDLKGLRGIYRYKRSNGEVVYIGRGKILSRLNSLERKEWDFDTIEYSIIEDPEEQAKWEDYWLTKFKENEDRRPFYNKIDGKRSRNE